MLEVDMLPQILVKALRYKRHLCPAARIMAQQCGRASALYFRPGGAHGANSCRGARRHMAYQHIVMSPLQSLASTRLGWSAEAFGYYAGAEYMLNVFGFLILAGIILDKGSRQDAARATARRTRQDGQ